MRELKVIDVENSTLIVTHPDGEEFRVLVDAAAMHRLRGSRSVAESVRVSPKDVQAHIRAGMSADEVAAVTGASLDFISRFEGPVLAEREFIVNSALAVQTQAVVDLESGETSSAFGALVHSRLTDLGASGERWASWKEPDGTWVIKLQFETASIEHDARWVFEPRKHSLSPLNSDAAILSQKDDLTTGIIPRLRAVPGETPRDLDSEFETTPPTAPPSQDSLATVSHLEFVVSDDEFTYDTNVFVGVADLFSTAEVETRPESVNDTGTSPTADLLEALRRRRGERESTPAWLREELSISDLDARDEAQPATPQPPALFPEHGTTEPPQRTGSHARRERTSMPSWDEIVFGTRSDDEGS